MKKFLILIGFVVAYSCGLYHGSQISETPHFQLVKVHDGDTIIVNITNWPKIIGYHIPIRLKNINAPELNEPSEKGKVLALKAKTFAEEKLRGSFQIQNLERDKYFRLRANVIVHGKDLSELLLKAGLAKEYHGEKRSEWH